ncbi:hypothetical protein GCM10009107_19620 [Ideonella azotifigens]|uniref:Uncharacterized protein n=1 Tax=Ideonella azotifigens TaxID=513160 RepID=A0ABP3V862_9BURK
MCRGCALGTKTLAGKVLKGHHEAYVGWAEFERDQKQLAANAYSRADGVKVRPWSAGLARRHVVLRSLRAMVDGGVCRPDSAGGLPL